MQRLLIFRKCLITKLDHFIPKKICICFTLKVLFNEKYCSLIPIKLLLETINPIKKMPFETQFNKL